MPLPPDMNPMLMGGMAQPQTFVPPQPQSIGQYAQTNWADLLFSGLNELAYQASRADLTPAQAAAMDQQRAESERDTANRKRQEQLEMLKLQADMDYRAKDLEIKRENLAQQRVLLGMQLQQMNSTLGAQNLAIQGASAIGATPEDIAAFGAPKAAEMAKERQQAFNKAQDLMKSKDVKDKAALTAITNIKDILKDGFAGGVWQNADFIKGGNAYNLKAQLETLKGAVGLDELGQMKALSSTGASGLGALSEKELSLLTSIMGSLDAGQDPSLILGAVNQVESIISQGPQQRQEAFQRDFGDLSGGGSTVIMPAKPDNSSTGMFNTGNVNTNLPGSQGMTTIAPDVSVPQTSFDPTDLQFMTPEERALFQ